MSHPTLAAAASTSAPALRHRSSTLKPLHDDPAPVQPHPPPVARSKSSQTPAAPAPAPIPSTPRTGLRAHLAQLLPRHAVFRARITLHQLNNVPLVRGEFAVRWHVRGVVGRGFLSKVKVRSNGGRPNASHPSHSAKGKEPDVDTASLVGPSISDTHSVTASSSTHSYDHASSASSHASVAAHRPPVVPALVVSPGSSTSSVVPPLASRSVSGTSLSAASPREPLPQRYLSMDWFPHPHPVHDPPPSRLPLPPEQYSPAKSRTPFVSLKDHNVVWQQPLDFLVQMAIRRESGELLSSPASFVVMQRVIPGDPDAPRNPRVGIVHINLAQYVGAGVVTRRYLLRQSKTNATLELTVQIEHTDGPTSYTPPPLPKGEIHNGIAALLECDAHLRPRVLGLYASSSSPSSSCSTCSSDSDPADVESLSSLSSALASTSLSKNDISPSTPAHRHKHKHPRHRGPTHPRKPFNLERLPDVRSPRATEKLIEALFNPVPVTQLAGLSPFTYLDPADEGDDNSNGSGNGGQVQKDVAAIEEGVAGASDLDSEGEGEGEGESESEYHSARSWWSASHHSIDEGRDELSVPRLRHKRSWNRLGVLTGRKPDVRSVSASAASEAVVCGVAVEKRAWWQKVLRST